MFAVTILVLCQATGTPSSEPDEIPLPVRVNHAIARGVECLKRLQLSDGSFAGLEAEHPGGITALVAFTLARSGVRKDDPAIQRAWSVLAGVQFQSTYSAAVHLMLCEALRDPARAEEAQRSLDFLIENRRQGVWAYPKGKLDNSNTQFALLGLRAARLLGLEVPEEVWLEALDGLSRFRDKDGGFFYATAGPRAPNASSPDAGMTAASLASLAVLQEAAVDHARLRSALANDARSVKEGTRWLERYFDVTHNYYEDGSWKANWDNAYLWAVERWCGLTGRARIGEHDWYAEGATRLLDTQLQDGSWDGAFGPAPICFALLFLRRATITPDEALPVLEAQLERARTATPDRYESPGRGARRLTRWWLAGPWLQGTDKPLLLDPPFDPADVKPRARGKLGRREWELVDLQRERWTDLDLLTGSQGDARLWVLATRLAAPSESESAALEALLWLELDDGWDVWFDGQRLSRELRRGGNRPCQVSFPLRLAPGEHVLTVLVEDLKGMAVFGALLNGRDNGPPPEALLDDPELENARKETK